MSHHIPGNWGRASKSTQISRNCARWFLNWQDILWRRAFCLKRAWENMKCSNWWAFLLLFLWRFTSVLTSSQSLGLMGSCLNQQSEQWHSSWLLHVVKTETYSMESQSCGKSRRCVRNTSQNAEPFIYANSFDGENGLSFIWRKSHNPDWTWSFSLNLAYTWQLVRKLGWNCISTLTNLSCRDSSSTFACWTMMMCLSWTPSDLLLVFKPHAYTVGLYILKFGVGHSHLHIY